MKRPFVLITNDDGIDSPGISALANEFAKFGEVVVVAPDKQQSAVGHALTIQNPLRVSKFQRNGSFFGFAVNGTPSDCVKLAISNILERRPNLVVSGINHGQNTAINILYSGTVSAASEGTFVGIPSIAVSIASYDLRSDCKPAAEIAREIVEKLWPDMPENTLLNINIPDLAREEIKGIMVTRQSEDVWNDKYELREDPFGRKYYWFAGDFLNGDGSESADYNALKTGYVSVTPVHYKLTDEDTFAFLKKKL